MKLIYDDNDEIKAHKITLYREDDEYKQDPIILRQEGDYLYIESWLNLEIYPDASNRLHLFWSKHHE